MRVTFSGDLVFTPLAETAMSSDSENPSTETPTKPDWTDKQLPPVKPPTTGLLMQLFFVPMVIVSIIVGVWLMFGWLAQSGTNPEQLAANLQQLNKGSWQDAHGLSNMLFDPREEELRHNEELANGLAEILDKLLEDKMLETSEERVKLATWLCRAIGAFEIDNGLDTLVKATECENFEIRREAIKGISTLASNLETDITESHPDLVEQLESPAMERAEGSESEELMKFGEIRSTTAYALGVIGGEDATSTLNLMLGDAYPEARYNAATGLARNGDLRAVPRLCEMLSLDNDEATLYEVKEAQELRKWKRNLVIVNGLRGVKGLYSTNKEAAVDETITEAVEKLRGAAILQRADALVLDDVMRFLNER